MTEPSSSNLHLHKQTAGKRMDTAKELQWCMICANNNDGDHVINKWNDFINKSHVSAWLWANNDIFCYFYCDTHAHRHVMAHSTRTTFGLHVWQTPFHRYIAAVCIHRSNCDIVLCDSHNIVAICACCCRGTSVMAMLNFPKTIVYTNAKMATK